MLHKCSRMLQGFRNYAQMLHLWSLMLHQGIRGYAWAVWIFLGRREGSNMLSGIQKNFFVVWNGSLCVSFKKPYPRQILYNIFGLWLLYSLSSVARDSRMSFFLLIQKKSYIPGTSWSDSSIKSSSSTGSAIDIAKWITSRDPTVNKQSKLSCSSCFVLFVLLVWSRYFRKTLSIV